MRIWLLRLQRLCLNHSGDFEIHSSGSNCIASHVLREISLTNLTIEAHCSGMGAAVIFQMLKCQTSWVWGKILIVLHVWRQLLYLVKAYLFYERYSNKSANDCTELFWFGSNIISTNPWKEEYFDLHYDYYWNYYGLELHKGPRLRGTDSHSLCLRGWRTPTLRFPNTEPERSGLTQPRMRNCRNPTLYCYQASTWKTRRWRLVGTMWGDPGWWMRQCDCLSAARTGIVTKLRVGGGRLWLKFGIH